MPNFMPTTRRERIEAAIADERSYDWISEEYSVPVEFVRLVEVYRDLANFEPMGWIEQQRKVAREMEACLKRAERAGKAGT